MARIDNAERLSSVLLIKQIVGNAHVAIIALLEGVVDGEGCNWVIRVHVRVAAIAPHVGVLTLFSRLGLVRAVVNITRVGRASKGPGGNTGRVTQGLGKEPDGRVSVGKLDGTLA